MGLLRLRRWTLVLHLVIYTVVGESSNLQGLSRFEEHGQQMLTHVDFALVHEMQEGLHLRVVDVLEKYDWMRMDVL